ncbi:MAG: hypothetical protein K2Q10_10855, partial [Rhodospirillales bacterium]|nr:hypothetical protein [Rhodospirillales bacterium]
GVVTCIALTVIVESKFSEGAWMTVLLIPAILILFHTVKRHYGKVSKELSPRHGGTGRWLRKLEELQPKVVVPISKLHRGTLAALHFARSISTDVTAVVVDIDPDETASLRLAWRALRFKEPLEVLDSPYRSVVAPLLDYLEHVDAREPERGAAVVVLPLFVPSRWWHHLLHNQTALMLKAALLYRKQPGNETRIVVDVPYHLQQ